MANNILTPFFVLLKLKAINASQKINKIKKGACSIISNSFNPVPDESLFSFKVNQFKKRDMIPKTAPVKISLLGFRDFKSIIFTVFNIDYFKNPFSIKKSLATLLAFSPSTAILELSFCRVIRSKPLKTGSRIFSISGYFSKTAPLIIGAGA